MRLDLGAVEFDVPQQALQGCPHRLGVGALNGLGRLHELPADLVLRDAGQRQGFGVGRLGFPEVLGQLHAVPLQLFHLPQQRPRLAGLLHQRHQAGQASVQCAQGIPERLGGPLGLGGARCGRHPPYERRGLDVAQHVARDGLVHSSRVYLPALDPIMAIVAMEHRAVRRAQDARQ